jgi:hypothetical protein
MQGIWEEGIHHLKGTKHQVPEALEGKYIFIYFEIKKSLPFSLQLIYNILWRA